MNKPNVWLLGAVLLSASVVLAQPAGGPEPGTGEGSGSAAAPAAGGPVPLAINDRSLVLDKGMLEVHGGIPIATSTTPGVMGMASTSSTTESLAVGGNYGVAPKIDAGLDYIARLHPDASAKGLLSLHGGFAAMHTDKLDLAVTGGLTFLFVDTVAFDPTTMMTTTSTTTFASLNIGASVRYRVTPKVSVFTGNPQLPAGLPGFFGLVFPPVTNQLSIGINNSGPTTLSLPVGAGLQATPNVYAFLATDLADFGLSGSNNNNRFIFADFIPLGVGGFYSMPKLDIGVEFSDNLKNAGDFYIINLLARFYVK